MQFYYGVEGKYHDITSDVLNKCLVDGIIKIPAGDHNRALIFGDPVVNVLKNIKVVHGNGDEPKIYDATQAMEIVYPHEYKKLSRQEWWEQQGVLISDKQEQLRQIHNHLNFKYGSLNDEFPEQLMAITYIKPESTVLELGANIGRNTCIIAQILSDDRRLVTLESNPTHVEQVTCNRDLNNFNFNIEPSALSKRPLIQLGWDTKVVNGNEPLPHGHFKVNTIDWDSLRAKYNLEFDTLVADCEGALYYIMLDEPDFFKTFKTIIMENDYNNINHKNAIDENLLQRGFKCVYSRAGGWGPCAKNFFEVWQINN
jgi:FkbM family methyltransferase